MHGSARQGKEVRMRKFPYEEPLEENEEYLKDRDELFKKNGQGWWCATPRKYNRKSSKYHNRVTAKDRQGFNFGETGETSRGGLNVSVTGFVKKDKRENE